VNPVINIIAQVRRKYPGMNNQANITGGITMGSDTNCGIETVLPKNMTASAGLSLAGG
jgi:hypothetical protein